MKTKTLFWICILTVNLIFAAPTNFSETVSSSEKEQINASTVGTCTIKVYTKLENGTLIEGTVTISGDEMNFLKCWGIKLFGLFSSAY